MGSEHKLADSDLQLLLEKKLSLLVELFQLAQAQLPLLDKPELEPVLDQKDECLEQVQKIDSLIADWQSQHTRPFNDQENQILDRIRYGLEDIWETEQKFEQRLKQEKDKVSAEMARLRNRSQVRNYLGNRSKTGKHLNLRR